MPSSSGRYCWVSRASTGCCSRSGARNRRSIDVSRWLLNSPIPRRSWRFCARRGASLLTFGAASKELVVQAAFGDWRKIAAGGQMPTMLFFLLPDLQLSSFLRSRLWFCLRPLRSICSAIRRRRWIAASASNSRCVGGSRAACGPDIFQSRHRSIAREMPDPWDPNSALYG